MADATQQLKIHDLLAVVKSMAMAERYQLKQLLNEKAPHEILISNSKYLNTNQQFKLNSPEPYEEYVCDVHKCVLKKMEWNYWSCPKCHEVYYAAQQKLQKEVEQKKEREIALHQAEKEAARDLKVKAREQRKAAEREKWRQIIALKKEMDEKLKQSSSPLLPP